MIAGGGVTGGAEAAIAQAPVAATTTSPPASGLTSVASKLAEQQLAGHVGLEARQLTWRSPLRARALPPRRSCGGDRRHQRRTTLSLGMTTITRLAPFRLAPGSVPVLGGDEPEVRSGGLARNVVTARGAGDRLADPPGLAAEPGPTVTCAPRHERRPTNGPSARERLAPPVLARGAL